MSGQNPPYRPTGETCLIIVPPPDVCAYADYYRSRYMPDTVRAIEPHITVLFPFVPYDKLPEAEPRLRKVMSAREPTRLSLRGFATFPSTGTLYLYIAHPERVVDLYKAVLAEFPDYPAYGGQFGDNIVPHLTVGKFADRHELDMVYQELSVQRLFIGFDVDKIVVKCKMDDGIWDTWAEIPLGKGESNPL